MSKRAAVFLDRDGVLNAALVSAGVPEPPRRPEDLELLPGVEQACAQLADAGLVLIVVTNQPDIARGLVDRNVVDNLNKRLLDSVALRDVIVCPHDDGDACACRKPKPGMLLEGASKWGIDLSRSVMVGDRWRDIEAGRAAGTRTVFIDRGYDEPAPEHPDLTVNELHESVPWIIQTAGPQR
jgi:D-glycero-D-manno-heptose 1,7-bisphosphate phosphatase